MTVNRLTYEQLQSIAKGTLNTCVPVIDDSVHFDEVCAIVPESKWDERMIMFTEMAQELLTLRKENERLRMRIEVGEEMASNANCIQVNHLKICYQDVEQCFCGLDDLTHSVKKWRESGVE